MKKEKKREYQEGYEPPGMFAWCALHGKGMNLTDIRVKHCLIRGSGKPCTWFRWEREEKQATGDRQQGTGDGGQRAGS